ncbi:MAG: thioredoxin family protein [Halocynthiibacter sp.]
MNTPLNRRRFILSASLLALAPLAVNAGEMDYKPGLAKAELAAGKTVIVAYVTDWCPTCNAQKRAINTLLSENPEYKEKISVLWIDYDVHGKGDLAKELRIPRRSVIVALKGQDEVGRVVAQTDMGIIKKLFDDALKA